MTRLVPLYVEHTTQGASVCVRLPLQANLKKFMDYVQTGAVEKLGKALEKGLDPNYHDTESGGETHRLSVLNLYPHTTNSS